MADSVMDVDEAQARLAELVSRAEAGHAVTLTRDGRAVAQLIPVNRRTEPRVPGAWRGRVVVHEDLALFTGADAAQWYGR